MSWMKAAVYDRYGGPEVVSLVRLPIPVPGPGQVLVRIRAATVSSADSRLRAADFPAGFGWMARLALGITGPRARVLGTDFAGVVDQVGPGVTALSVGDRVFAWVGSGLGCHAEYRLLDVDGAWAPIPEGMEDVTAAALGFGGGTGLHFLDAANVGASDRVLVVGASGAVGSAMVQLALHRGAEVVGVCSGRNADQVRAMGASVVDYTQDEPTGVFDVVVDTVGLPAVELRPRVNTTNGRLVQVIGSLWDLLAAPFRAKLWGMDVVGGEAPERAEDLRKLAKLAVAGVFTPWVQRMDFSDIQRAHRIASSGRKRGNVVLTFDDDVVG